MFNQQFKTTTDPTVEPVSLAEAKVHLRVGAPGGTATSITKANPGVVTKNSHGLATGDVITWTAAAGMVELNGSITTVTYVSDDTFSIGENTSGYTTATGVETYVFNHDDDDYITDLITAARERVELDQERALITQTITLKMDRFPAGNFFTLPRPRLISVTSIKYNDTDGDEQTLSSANYVVDVYSEPGRVALENTESWPSTEGNINDVEVIYTAGWGAAATNVPLATKQAMLLLIGDTYRHREQQIDTLSMAENLAYKALIQKHKVEQYA